MQVIRQAYGKLDKNRDGRVTLEDIANMYDASQSLEVRTGKGVPEEVFKVFISSWDTRKKDGIVTLDEFVDFYTVFYLLFLRISLHSLKRTRTS